MPNVFMPPEVAGKLVDRYVREDAAAAGFKVESPPPLCPLEEGWVELGVVGGICA